MIVLGLSIASHAQEGKNPLESEARCASIYADGTMGGLALKELATEYQRLRSIDCRERRWQSDYHRVLEHLATKLEGRSRRKVIRLMGPPDITEKARLIYFWRGYHDYVYFIIARGVVVKSGWYHAYE